MDLNQELNQSVTDIIKLRIKYFIINYEELILNLHTLPLVGMHSCPCFLCDWRRSYTAVYWVYIGCLYQGSTNSLKWKQTFHLSNSDVWIVINNTVEQLEFSTFPINFKITHRNAWLQIVIWCCLDFILMSYESILQFFLNCNINYSKSGNHYDVLSLFEMQTNLWRLAEHWASWLVWSQGVALCPQLAI